MQRNLALAPTKQHPEESQQIKEAVYEWREQDPRTRPTQGELARKLCDLLGREKLSKQYVNRLVNTLPPRHRGLPLTRHYAPPIPQEESQRDEPPRQADPSPSALEELEQARGVTARMRERAPDLFAPASTRASKEPEPRRSNPYRVMAEARTLEEWQRIEQRGGRRVVLRFPVR